MKRLTAFLALFFVSPVMAQTSQPLVVVGGAIKTIPAPNALQIPSMAGSGARCVQADATGTLTVAAGACATGGSGSVTSVAVSGGTTGITVTGSPVTTSGTITLGGTLGVTNGGTGGTSAGTARSNLGLVIGTDVQAFDSNLAAYAGGDAPSVFTLGIVDSTDATAWRSALGAGTGSGSVTSIDVSGGTTGLTSSGGPVTTSGTITLGGTLGVTNGGTGATTLTGYIKGSGVSAFTAASTVPGSDISGDISGNAANVTGTVAVANGGTGATTSAGARSAFGLAIGTNVEAWDADLDALAALSGTNTIYYRSAASTWSPVSIGSGISFSGGSLSATGSGGSVTSIDVSGGTTGLTSSGGPVTTSGTITLAGTLVAANGGTGQTSYAIGDTLYASSSSALSKLSAVATGNALISGGTATAPSWGKIGLTTHVSGTLAVGNGGTGATTLTGYIKGNGTSAFTASSTVPGSDVSGNISGNAANVTGTVAVANGGTGATSITTNYLVQANGSSAFSASPVYIDGSSRVLVGATSVSNASWSNELHTAVSGAFPLGLSGVDRGVVIRNSANTSGYYAFFEYNGGTNNGSISWSGATTSFNTTSDRRLKDHITDSPESGALIDRIKIRSWDWKADGKHWRYGVIAQELLPLVPEAVSVPDDPAMMMGVDYSKLVPLLVKEIQSLRVRVSQLEKRTVH